jgi:hypothetical protein
LLVVGAIDGGKQHARGVVLWKATLSPPAHAGTAAADAATAVAIDATVTWMRTVMVSPHLVVSYRRILVT